MDTSETNLIYRLWLLMTGICCLAVPASGQQSLSEAYDYYRMWGEQTTFEWAAIRASDIQADSVVASITQDVNNESFGYVVYPAKIGNLFQLIQDKEALKAIRRMGYLQLPVSSAPEMVRECAYTPWLFGNEMLTAGKYAANAEAIDRFFQSAKGEIKVRRALWYYFNSKEPEQKWPSPTVDNMYFFQGKSGDYDQIQMLLSSGKQGYILCPVWTEDITGALDSPELNPEIKGSGMVEFLLTENPLSIALNFNVWEEVYETLSKADVIPFVYQTDYTKKVSDWLLSMKELYPETIRSFYCYFDHRKPEEVQADKAAGNCVAPVFKEDGLNDEAATLAERIRSQKNNAFTIVPYWAEDTYLKLEDSVAGKINRVEYLGCAIDPSNGTMAILDNWQTKACVADYPPFDHKPFDLMVLFRGAEATDRMLASKDDQLQLIKSLLEPGKGMMLRDLSLRKPNGVNFYFPDYSFQRKRDLVQFCKSISFVIDSFCVNGEKLYSDYDLTLTFPIAAREHMGFLSILLKYRIVDRLCFVDYDEWGAPLATWSDPANPEGGETKMVIYEGDYDSSLFDNLWNSLFYLLNPFPFGDELFAGCSDDIEELANAQFTAPVLLYLMATFIILTAGLLVVIGLYLTYSKFYIYVRHKQRYMVPVLLTWISEILLVLYLITNVVSTRETYNIWTQLFILFLPFVFFILSATPFSHHEKEPLP